MKKNKDIIETSTKIGKKILLIIFLALFLGMCGAGGYIFYSLSPVSETDNETIIFTIEDGWGANTVGKELAKQGIIRSEMGFKLYLKSRTDMVFKKGTYELNKTMTLDEIATKLTNGANALSDDIQITFVEGKRYPYYMEKIAESFNLNKDEITKYTTSNEYLDKVISKYWFIDESVKNKDLYYPLEGYIYADTYSFKKESTIDEVMDKLLGTMESKLNIYKSDIEASGKSIHSLLTMASMVELEAVTPEDRLDVAGVFYNRISKSMSMGSDVTTYYAAKKEMKDSLYMSEINMCNAYNTRGTCAVSYPVGPIASPSLSSLIAAIKPNKNDYLFFVADKKNKVYFSKTEAEQLRVIADLRSKGLWPE